jgi:hypothetical protein
MTIAGAWLVSGKRWQTLQFDADWARLTADQAKPLVGALESYKRSAGAYPARVEDMVPGHLAHIPACPAHPSGNGGGAWRYRLDAEHGYVLAVFALHWVNSFDTLVLHGDRRYPDWEAEGFHTRTSGDWVYVVGGSTIMQRTGLPDAVTGD